MTTMNGLENVPVAETRLSHIDGERGRLVIAGHSVEDLAGARSFEAVCGLLWGEEPERVRRALGRARVAAFEQLGGLEGALAMSDGMSALRAGLARLDAATLREARSAITATAAVIAAAWARRQQGERPIPPDAEAGHAADLLRCATGRRDGVAALDAYLVTVCDHGMNASTFTARVIASTGSDDVSAVTGAIGALKGPLHGGAPGPVLDMLDAIGSPDRARSWLEQELQAGRRIMGMGHRVCRVRDPRAAVFERVVEQLRGAGVGTVRLDLARAVEREATDLLSARYPTRPMAANVEFYTAVLLDAIGLPRTLFAPVFACSRVAGWLAHCAEQRATGRLIRPTATYVGPVP